MASFIAWDSMYLTIKLLESTSDAGTCFPSRAANEEKDMEKSLQRALPSDKKYFSGEGDNAHRQRKDRQIFLRKYFLGLDASKM